MRYFEYLKKCSVLAKVSAIVTLYALSIAVAAIPILIFAAKAPLHTTPPDEDLMLWGMHVATVVSAIVIAPYVFFVVKNKIEFMVNHFYGNASVYYSYLSIKFGFPVQALIAYCIFSVVYFHILLYCFRHSHNENILLWIEYFYLAIAVVGLISAGSKIAGIQADELWHANKTIASLGSRLAKRHEDVNSLYFRLKYQKYNDNIKDFDWSDADFFIYNYEKRQKILNHKELIDEPRIQVLGYFILSIALALRIAKATAGHYKWFARSEYGKYVWEFP